MLNLLKRREKDPREELRRLLGEYDLPGVSSGIIELLDLLRDQDVPMSKVATLVEMDPGLTVRILQLINSAGFGLLSKVSNLQHAVSLLGRSRLESLVLTFAAAEQIPTRMECMETHQFWVAAARRASLARVVAQHMHAATQAEAFTAGLLHDIGVPVLSRLDPEAYSKILKEWHEDDDSHLDVMEREKFGVDHSSVGALMAEDWGLPDYLNKAIAGHHAKNGESDVDPAIRLVSLVKYFPENEGRMAITKAGEALFEIEGPLMEEMIERSFADAAEFAGMFFR